jgi:hypothetical protein
MSLIRIRIHSLGVALFLVLALIFSFPPPSLQHDELFQDLRKRLDDPPGGGSTKCADLNATGLVYLITGYTNYSSWSDKQLLNFSKSSHDSGGHEALALLTSLINQVCDFSATPTPLACNIKVLKCQNCTDQNMMNDMDMKWKCMISKVAAADLVKARADKAKAEGKGGGEGAVGAVAVSTFLLAGSILYYSIVAVISFPA